jgi:hypothetical protein
VRNHKQDLKNVDRKKIVIYQKRRRRVPEETNWLRDKILNWRRANRFLPLETSGDRPAPRPGPNKPITL